MTASAWPTLVHDAPPLAKAASPTDETNRVLRQAFDGFAADVHATGALQDGTAAAVRARVQAAAKALGVAFTEDLYNRVSAAYARQHPYDRGTLQALSDTTRGLVGTTLHDAYAGGWTYDETAAALGSQFDQIEVWQVQRIARTEIATASRQGSVQSVQAIARDHQLTITRAVLVPVSGCEEICLPLVRRSYDENWSPAQAAQEIAALHPNCLHDLAFQVEN